MVAAMTEPIRPLTPQDIRESAEAAARQHIRHADANHFCPGTEEWRIFARAYTEALPQISESV